MIYLYFLGLSYRNTAKAFSFLLLVKISHVSFWKWMQKYKPHKYRNKNKIEEYSCIQKDETAIEACSELIWL
jgi:putative transposase